MSTERSGVTVRHGRAGDGDQLVQLEAMAFGDRAWPGGTIANSLTIANTYVLMAEGPEITGAAGFLVWRRIVDEAEILSVGVAASARRRGVGRALLVALEGKVRSKGLRRIMLDVDATNRAALALYQACGYHQTGVRRYYYRNGADAIMMAKGVLQARSATAPPV